MLEPFFHYRSVCVNRRPQNLCALSGFPKPLSRVIFTFASHFSSVELSRQRVTFAACAHELAWCEIAVGHPGRGYDPRPYPKPEIRNPKP